MKKVILIGVCLQKTIDFEENIEEMKNLAQANNFEIVHTITQNLRTPHKQTYINSGKVEEVKEQLEKWEVDTLLFDCEISPSQLRNLEAELECDIIDKTNLILQIFESRAQTKEAKLQVEVAKLKYELPRLSGSYDNLDKQRGGGNRNKGSGEKALNLDSRHIGNQIHSIEHELKDIAQNRETQRRMRMKKEIKNIALVGYTNAGKSSILNASMDKFDKEDKKVFEKDMLFATLTTNTRNITMSNKHQFLLSDTVGFISDLPHNLIKAFHSTLEEVIGADLLLHVIDINNPEYLKHIRVTEETLKEIKADHIPIIYVYNKCDLTDIDYPIINEDSIYICSKQAEGIDMLLNEIDQRLFNTNLVLLDIPYHEGALVSHLNKQAQIIRQEERESGTLIECELEDSLYEKVKKYEVKS